MIGVDEVGRGCLAGPLLVVAARAAGDLPAGVKDSKLLSRQQREDVYKILIDACSFGQGWVKASEIDRYGLSRALKLGARRALVNLGVPTDEEVILDGNFNYIPKKYKNSRCEIDADENIPLVSAASIYAKVTRDRFMIQLASRHPKYSFENHVGYGTPEHYQAIDSFGPLKFIHRASFAPFKLEII